METDNITKKVQNGKYQITVDGKNYELLGQAYPGDVTGEWLHNTADGVVLTIDMHDQDATAEADTYPWADMSRWSA